MGRWSYNKAVGSITDKTVSTMFPGMYLDMRFTGTSLGLRLGNVDDPVTILFRVDDNRDFQVLPYGREVVSIVDGLKDAEHQIRIMFQGAKRTDIEVCVLAECWKRFTLFFRLTFSGNLY